MKRITIIVLSFFIIGMNMTLSAQKKKEQVENKAEEQKISTILNTQEMTEEQSLNYALGAYIGGIMKDAGVIMDPNVALLGLTESYSGKNQFDEMRMQQIFGILNQRFQAQQMKGADIEKERGRNFLAENKKNAGVIETASGLQYKVIRMGNGPKPLATDRVKVHYHGTTIDGVVFDSSVERNEPIVFGLNQVIRGWTEGVQLMPVGSKFIFYIPSDLAYGDGGAGGAIKPGAMLIFEVELFEINPAE